MSENPLPFTEWQELTLDEQLAVITSWPVEHQLLVVGLATFAVATQLQMAEEVSELTHDEFEEALDALVLAGYVLNDAEAGRVSLESAVCEVVNGPMQDLWRSQQDE